MIGFKLATVFSVGSPLSNDEALVAVRLARLARVTKMVWGASGPTAQCVTAVSAATRQKMSVSSVEIGGDPVVQFDGDIVHRSSMVQSAVNILNGPE